MQVGKRFGGHIVQGHIDGIGTVIELKKDRSGQSITVRVKEDLIRYITPKGSITINGVSLTVVDVIAGNVVLYVIPETIRQTILFEIRVGDMVNIEVDILAKYTESILSARDSSTENHDTLKQKLYNEGFL
jgi:riboflavin synthase